MEGDTFSGFGNGTQVDTKILQAFQKSFVQVQSILDQNRLLINEINQNHESKIPDNLTRNVSLIRELNNNIRRVVDLYSDLSISFTKSMEASSEGESDVKHSHKRVRPVLDEATHTTEAKYFWPSENYESNALRPVCRTSSKTA